MTESPTPFDLVHEAGHGQSERTPVIALTGLFIAISTVVALVAGVALIIYYVA
jgi:hypothetical protein